MTISPLRTRVEVRPATTPRLRWLRPGNAGSVKILQPSVLAEENIWNSRAQPQLDVRPQGRLWSRRGPQQDIQPSAKGIETSVGISFRSTHNRCVTRYDPKTGIPAINCSAASHPVRLTTHADDLGSTAAGRNVGWINTGAHETGDIEKAKGWTALGIDTNGTACATRNRAGQRGPGQGLRMARPYTR